MEVQLRFCRFLDEEEMTSVWWFWIYVCVCAFFSPLSG